MAANLANHPAPLPADVRALVPDDLARVVEIDRANSGQSRRGYFAKRFRALSNDHAALVALGYPRQGMLQGFVLAQILDGEFGGRFPVATMDAIGVAPDMQRLGVGQALITALDARLRRTGVRELRSEAAWTAEALLRLFAACGFHLAPRHVLERPTGLAVPAGAATGEDA
ncbi:MAG: GNAT family N-acetyltransferase [Alphaproteobacteria bacterium]|nr:GNAT family N-acetyltransferase [Alphaproteobacteria bacterium]